jgi:hypothetical protein
MHRVLFAAALAALVLAPTAGAWSWPIDGEVLRPFSFDSHHPYAAGQHRGIDIASPAGAPVRAPAAGRVSFAGSVPKSGKTVTIQTGDGYSVTLVHLGSIAVTKLSTPAEGDVVGTIGPSGEPEVDEPYVHLGVRVTAEEEGYVDPLSLLPPRDNAPSADAAEEAAAAPSTEEAQASSGAPFEPAPSEPEATAPPAPADEAPAEETKSSPAEEPAADPSAAAPAGNSASGTEDAAEPATAGAAHDASAQPAASDTGAAAAAAPAVISAPSAGVG